MNELKVSDKIMTPVKGKSLSVFLRRRKNYIYLTCIIHKATD